MMHMFCSFLSHVYSYVVVRLTLDSILHRRCYELLCSVFISCAN